MLIILAIIKKPNSVYKNKPSEQNPFEGKRIRFVVDDSDPVNADGVRGHLETIAISEGENGDNGRVQNRICRSGRIYEHFIKRGIDIGLSMFSIIVLSPVLIIISVAIFIDDPGPVLFIQKRVGKNKQYFKLHKFRSMKMSTPHDVPTHMLVNPSVYITRVGAILRKTSLDEIPQIWDILLGNMSLIGPRPALWNQDKLVALRDNVKVMDGKEVNVNNVRPGLTGLAQISGRDKLGLGEKSRIDGEYCANISLSTDVRCFFETIASVVRHDGVVEGSTNKMQK